jgi:hypothetical protein
MLPAGRGVADVLFADRRERCRYHDRVHRPCAGFAVDRMPHHRRPMAPWCSGESGEPRRRSGWLREDQGVIVGLLVVLGVDVGVIVAGLGLVIARRIYVSRQPGAFKGTMRATAGQGKRKRGYGRWVRDVLVWYRAPFLFRTQLIPITRAVEVRRQSDQPWGAALETDDGSRIEIAAAYEDREKALGPFAEGDE